jgi:RHS repeat-associated protein
VTLKDHTFIVKISEAAPPPSSWTTTYTYTYDPLYRLAGATYSSGEFFEYTYDAVGNRLSETTHLGTTTYTYDNANRLADVNGVTYTWDDNGNLLSDGVNTYTYTNNKLSSITGNDLNITFQYNGLGERISQTVNGVTTYFTLDLNAGLSQVLSDGTNTYLYGVGRIAQADQVGKEYFLGDALGSVRQLTDATGAVTLSKSYEPYGDVMASAGDGTSAYGFTNEWTDSYINLLYLRARFYSPGLGRFLSRDVWKGDKQQSMSYNAWLYVEDNPINRRDPSGMISETEATEADNIVEELYTIYGVKIIKDWGRGYFAPPVMLPVPIYDCAPYWRNGNWRTLDEIRRIRDGVEKLAGPTGLGGAAKIRSALGTQLQIVRLNLDVSSFAPPGKLS